MSAQLSQLEIMLFGNARYQRAGWLIPLFLRLAPLGRDDVVAQTGVSEATAAKYLDDLARLGIIVRQGYHDGYVLAAGGKQLVAQSLLDAGTPTAAVVDAETISDDSRVESANCTFDSSRKKEEDSNLIIKDSLLLSDSRVESANCTFDFARALEHSSLLFGGAIVYATGLEPRDWQTTLGFMAQCYDQRDRLRNPAGVVYSKLQKGKEPDRKYYDNPVAYLPDTYLDALGMFEKACPRCSERFTNLGDFTAHWEKCLYTYLPEDDEVRGLSADETVTDDIRAAWQRALEQLDVPKASFETWVDGAEPVHCQPGRWQIGARNAYARDWLSRHVRERLETVLQVTVEIVAVETEE